MLFFFSSRRRHTRLQGDWSSDVCSSDLDFNRDGWMDLYVANDAVRNFLFRNNGDGTFTEMALLAEVAYGLQGKPQSGMGTDAADYDGDGWPDLFVTNIDYEPNNLYRNSGDETFTDVTISAKIGRAHV